ncbi:MAG: hypothetical protein RLZZ450_4831, partial [Pseudomonadota bacterium]
MIRGTHRAAVLASVAAVGCCCSTSWAAAQVATLDWSAPRGCPDRAYVAAQLAANHAETERHDLEVRARIQRTGRTRYVLRLFLRGSDAQAERRLEATSCASVTAAAIWLITVALSPSMRAPSQGVQPDEAAPVPQIDTNAERLAAPAVGAGSGSLARPDAEPTTPPRLARAEAASEPASRATETAESTTPTAAASGSTTSVVPLADP